VFLLFSVSHLRPWQPSCCLCRAGLGAYQLALPLAAALAGRRLCAALHRRRPNRAVGPPGHAGDPTSAFLVWSVLLFLRYLDQKRAALLYNPCFFWLLGLYTKQSIVFIVPVALWAVWRDRGMAVLRDRHILDRGHALAIGLFRSPS